MEEPKRAKSRGTLLQKARALWHALDDLLAGTAEPAWMEEVVESAARHMGFSDHEASACSNDLPGMENLVPSCEQECAHHAALMNPTIWSGLPVELLQSVFARLPLAGIIRLQCLSREWNRILNSHDFKQVCADAHPKLFAIIDRSSYSGRSIKVRLFDLRSNTWHEMVNIDIGYPLPFHTMDATDGGLVCFACTSKQDGSIHVPVLVCNPLTRAVRALPLHSHNKRPPMMLQLVMDRINKCYQVLIVSKDRSGGPVAEVFHSNTGAWTTTNLSHLKYGSGHRYSWHGNHFGDHEVPPCVYDCAQGQFLGITCVSHRLYNDDGCTKQYALVQDRLFILRKKDREAIEGGGYLEAEYYIAEFQAVESGAKWLKLKDHRCSDLGYSASSIYYSPGVHACKGFLLVVTYGAGSAYEHGLERLYDLSTGKWHALSPGFREISSFSDLMCELQWDSIP